MTTDKEMLEASAIYFGAIHKGLSRLSSGNLTHGVNNIRGLAQTAKALIERHLEETDGTIQKDIS